MFPRDPVRRFMGRVGLMYKQTDVCDIPNHYCNCLDNCSFQVTISVSFMLSKLLSLNRHENSSEAQLSSSENLSDKSTKTFMLQLNFILLKTTFYFQPGIKQDERCQLCYTLGVTAAESYYCLKCNRPLCYSFYFTISRLTVKKFGYETFLFEKVFFGETPSPPGFDI